MVEVIDFQDVKKNNGNNKNEKKEVKNEKTNKETEDIMAKADLIMKKLNEDQEYSNQKKTLIEVGHKRALVKGEISDKENNEEKGLEDNFEEKTTEKIEQLMTKENINDSQVVLEVRHRIMDEWNQLLRTREEEREKDQTQSELKNLKSEYRKGE